MDIRASARREESDITVRKVSTWKSKGMVQIAKSMHRREGHWFLGLLKSFCQFAFGILLSDFGLDETFKIKLSNSKNTTSW